MKKNYRAPHIADEGSHERGTATQVLRAEMINEKPFAATVDSDWTRAWEIVASIATFMLYLVLDTLKPALLMLCLVPAVLINYQAMQGQSNALLVLSVLSAIGAACCVLIVASDRFDPGRRVFATAVSLILVSYNFRNAVGMSATMHQAAQENYEQKVKENGNDQKRIDGKQGTYDEAVKVAGYVSVEDYEKQIIALQTTGYRTARWEGIGSTDHCNPLYIKTRDARELCNRFNDLDRKKDAAKSRDWLYGEIKNLQDTQPKPIRTRLDAEMENLDVLIGMFGYSLDADGKKTLKSAIDWQIGLLAEVIGTAGPEIVLLLFMMFDPRAAERERRKKAERKADRDSLRIEREARQDEKRKEAARRRAEKAEKAKPIPAVEPEINRPELKPEEMDGSDPQATAFLNRNTARVIGGRVPPKKLYEVWKSDCEERGIKPGTQRAFSERIAKFVNRETKNNRNTWVGIAIKDRNAAPELRVVGGDCDSAAKKGAKKGYSQCDSDGVAKTLSHLIAVSGAIFAITAISEEEEGLGRDFG